jgi:AmmeMemoRadiSam system protein B
MKIRTPAVAGAFYPETEPEVINQLKDSFGHWDIDYAGLKHRKGKKVIGIVAPHAGYSYSGYVAAKTYADIPKVDTVIILGPNHYGRGPNFSVSAADAWETPLGYVEVDKELAKEIVGDPVADFDDEAHEKEHSIEVQLPFLQSVLEDFKIVPISIKHYVPDSDFLVVCWELGKAIAEAVKKSGKNVLIVASTDFTHYEPQDVAEGKDVLAMDQIESLDEEGLFKIIEENNISMCGYAGVAVAMVASKLLGAKKGERVAYMTSGDTTGDSSQVVGYGGLILY